VSSLPLPLPDESLADAAGRAPRAPHRGPWRRERAFPEWRALLDLRAPYLIPILLVLASRGVLSLLLPHASEDAYITYRYARNLATGLGPVFNPGERVMGFTSPLWTGWNAVGWLLTHDPVGWSRLWTAAADVVSILCGAHLLERHVSRRSAWIFAAAIAGWVAFAGVAVSGMENGVLVALALLGAALVGSRSRVAGVALGALALTRPEGIAAAAILGLRARWRDRLAALAVAGAAYGALALYFGSPLPNSMAAKAGIYGLPGPWVGRQWWEWAFPFALGRWPSMADGRLLFLATILFAPAAWEGARALWAIRRTPVAAATAALVAIWAAYALSGVTTFFWYMAVPLAGWFLLVSAGLPRVTRGAAVLVSAALFTAGCWTVVWELYAARARAEAGFARAADFLVVHAAPADRVMLEPIGLIGYRTGLRVIDEVGLVSPRVARRRLEGPGWMSDLVGAERPEWMVVRRGALANHDGFAGAGAPFRDPAERDRVLAAYAVATVVEDPAPEASLVVLRRRAAAGRR
jgi:hypothetical protein